jgi:hypothetical protein
MAGGGIVVLRGVMRAGRRGCEKPVCKLENRGSELGSALGLDVGHGVGFTVGRKMGRAVGRIAR